MNLQKTFEAMLGRPVTIEEARELADTQFGTLSAYLRQTYRAYYPEFSERRANLRAEWNELNKKTPTDWEDYLLEAEKNAHVEALKNK